MRIHWNKNPIRTTVELTQEEREVFLVKARLRECQDAIRSALFHLDDTNKNGKFFSVQRAVAYLRHVETVKDPDCDNPTIMLDALESGYHCGDCICVATSCERCMAEDILGIDTIKGLSQHQALRIDAAFGKNGERSMEEALAILKGRAETQPERTGSWAKMTPERFEVEARKARDEARFAHDWLAAYRDEKQPT